MGPCSCSGPGPAGPQLSPLYATPQAPYLVSVLEGTTHTPPSATPLPRQASCAELPLVPPWAHRLSLDSRGLLGGVGEEASGGRSSPPTLHPRRAAPPPVHTQPGWPQSHWELLSSTPGAAWPMLGACPGPWRHSRVWPLPHTQDRVGESTRLPIGRAGPACAQAFPPGDGQQLLPHAGRLLPSLGHLSPEAAAVGGCQGGSASTSHHGPH